MPVYLREATGDRKRVYALDFSPEGFSITRTTDSLSFLVEEPPISLFSFLLAAQAEQLNPNEQLKFVNCRVRKGEDEGRGSVIVRPALSVERVVRPRGRFPERPPRTVLKRDTVSSMSEMPVRTDDVPFLYQVAVVEMHVLTGIEAASTSLAVHFHDVSEMFALLSGITPPRQAIVGGTVVVENDGGLFLKIGGSERAEISERERLEWLVILKRWLSGGYGYRSGARRLLINEFRSGTGLVFEGPPRDRNRRIPFYLARLSVHGIEERLSYRDVAELYSVLSLCRARENVEGPEVRQASTEKPGAETESAEKQEEKASEEVAA